MNVEVIALCGRRGSGKSTLAEICQENGYILLKFADKLKDIICYFLKYSRQELEEKKQHPIDFTFSKNNLEELSLMSKIPINFLQELLKNKIFYAPREMLQFLGTNVFREYKQTWHSDMLLEKIENGKKYVIDDVRFPSELDAIKHLNLQKFFIIRSNQLDYDNHPSEISLRWKDFEENELIFNNQSFSRFAKKWKQYLIEINNICKVEGFKSKLDLRNYLFEHLKNYDSTQLAEIMNCSRDKIVWWCNKLLVRIPKYKYNYNVNAFYDVTKESAYIAGLLAADGCVKLNRLYNSLGSFSSTDFSLIEKVKNYICPEKNYFSRSLQRHAFNNKSYVCKPSYDFDFNNELILENLKYWNFRKKKSTKEEIPDILKNDIENFKAWIVGLIDGDGCIYITKKSNNVTITILSSLSVIEYIKSKIPIDVNIIKHKSNLYQLNFTNKKAYSFYEWLNKPEYGLERKWNIIKAKYNQVNIND